MPFEAKGTIKLGADTHEADETLRTFEQTLRHTFKRVSGEVRPTAAIEQFVGNLASGDVIGAIEAVTRRLSVLGIVGGATFGVLAIALKEFVANIKASQEAFDGVERVMGSPALTTNLKSILDASNKLASFTGPLGMITREQQGDVAVRGDIAAKQHQLELTEKFEQATHAQIQRQQDTVNMAALEATGIKGVTEELKARLAVETELAAIQTAALDARMAVHKEEITGAGLPKEQVNKRMGAITDLVISESQGVWEKAAKVPAARLAGILHGMSGVSTDELQAAGTEASNVGFTRRFRQNVPVALQGDAYMLGIAQRSEAEGERLRKLGFRSEAETYFRRGEEIKSHLGSLKDSEKLPEYLFKNALDSSGRLQSMEQLLTDLNTSFKNFNLGNQ